MQIGGAEQGAVCGLGLQHPDALVLWSLPVRGLEEGPGADPGLVTQNPPTAKGRM